LKRHGAGTSTMLRDPVLSCRQNKKVGML